MGQLVLRSPHCRLAPASRGGRVTSPSYKTIYSSDIGEENNIADEHPEIIAEVKAIPGQVRTDENTWPLNDKKAKMPLGSRKAGALSDCRSTLCRKTYLSVKL